MGYLGATLTQVFTSRARAERACHSRDVTIAQMGNGASKLRMMSRTGSARRILGILKKVELRRVDFRLLAETFL